MAVGADIVRQLRLEKGLSIRALADKADVNYVFLSRLERGLETPSEDLVRRLAKALDYDGDINELIRLLRLQATEAGPEGTVQPAFRMDIASGLSSIVRVVPIRPESHFSVSCLATCGGGFGCGQPKQLKATENHLFIGQCTLRQGSGCWIRGCYAGQHIRLAIGTVRHLFPSPILQPNLIPRRTYKIGRRTN